MAKINLTLMIAETGRSIFFLAQDEKNKFHTSGNLPANPLKAAHELAGILTEKGYEEVTINVPMLRGSLPQDYSTDSFGVLSPFSADFIAETLSAKMKVNYTPFCPVYLDTKEYELKRKYRGV